MSIRMSVHTSIRNVDRAMRAIGRKLQPLAQRPAMAQPIPGAVDSPIGRTSLSMSAQLGDVESPLGLGASARLSASLGPELHESDRARRHDY